MAKPISATPTLTGEDAIRFLKEMKKKNNAKPSKIDKMFIQMLKDNKKFFSQAFD